MTNLECAIAVLATHREARRWADEAVAADVLARLGLDAAGEVGGVMPPMTEDEARAANYKSQLDAALNQSIMAARPEASSAVEQQAANDGAATQV